MCTSRGTNTVYVACDAIEVVSYTLQGQWKEISTFTPETITRGIGRAGYTIITGEAKQVSLYNKDGQQLSRIIIQQNPDNPICISTNGEMFYHRDGECIVGRTLKDRKEEIRYSHLSLIGTQRVYPVTEMEISLWWDSVPRTSTKSHLMDRIVEFYLTSSAVLETHLLCVAIQKEMFLL